MGRAHHLRRDELMGWLRRRYGAGPLHLLSLIACFALAGYAVSRIREEGGVVTIGLWFAASVIGHDLVLWPLYALADRRAVRLARRHPGRLPAVPWTNHLRVPVIMSVVLLGISLPLVLRVSAGKYFAESGVSESPYLGHWLLITGGLFAGSAVIYAIRLARARTRPAEVEHTFETGN
jgi:hypothetical protein